MSGTPPATSTPAASKKRFWAGWIVSLLPGLLFLSGGVNTARKASFVMPELARLGYPESAAFGMGIAVFLCTALYLIPQTAVLGAVLLTGYLGGAVASHVRLSEPFFAPLVVAIVVWIGIVLRENRLMALLPFRRPSIG